jgi:hypothetical protein
MCLIFLHFLYFIPVVLTLLQLKLYWTLQIQNIVDVVRAQKNSTFG